MPFSRLFGVSSLAYSYIETLLANHRVEIETGKLRVFLIDECHLMWGDAIGSVWGKTDQEITVPVVNEREKQTYYGAVDYQGRTITAESL